LSNLRLVDEILPECAPTEIVVETHAIGLNFADIFAIFGLYSATPKGSFIPGLEYAGVVVDKGAAVTNVELGQRVMGAVRFGAYTSHVVVDAHYAVPLPEGWSFAEGAAFIVQALTAYYALKHLGGLMNTAPADSAILIHSAAGGVGIYAHRIAKAMTGGQAFTIGTIGSAAKTDTLQRESYDRVLLRPRGNTRSSKRAFARLLGDALLDDTLPDDALHTRPLRIILDSLGGRIMQAGYEALAPAGRMVCFGSAHLAFRGNRPNYATLLWNYLQRPRLDPLAMIEENKGVFGFNLIYLWENLPLMQQMLAELDAMQLARPFVGQTFDFERLPEALIQFQSGTTVGKVVVERTSTVLQHSKK
jgi:alcohol dehydrogenase